MSGGDRTTPEGGSSRNSLRGEPTLVHSRERERAVGVVTDGGTRRHSPEDGGDNSREESDGRAVRTADRDPSAAHDPRLGRNDDPASGSGRDDTPESNRDGSATRDDRKSPTRDDRESETGDGQEEATRDDQRPATRDDPAPSERSRQQIEREIAELEQNPEQYETRDQAVIDRYEGLLAERRQKQREAEVDQETGSRQRLRRLKNRALRTLGLR